MQDVGGQHWVACHFAAELALQGISAMTDPALLPAMPARKPF
jgi:hypothetical protein